jgi:hypothetical protein
MFNKAYRYEALDAYLFNAIEQVARSANPGYANTTRSGRMTASAVCRMQV